MSINLQPDLFNQEIVQEKLREIEKYSITPTHGFGSGCSVQINKETYMLSHIPYSNKVILKKPDIVKINGTDFIYNFSKYVLTKEFIFKDFKDLIKKIDKWLIEKSCSKTDGKGYIYLVTDGKFTKIGATVYNVEKRLIELQTGNPYKLNIVGYYQVENKLSTEKFLHSVYKEQNILNEWFDLSCSDINYILSEKPTIKRDSMYQEIEDIDIDNIKLSLYANYKEYDEIIAKKTIRKLKKLEKLRTLINYNFESESN